MTAAAQKLLDILLRALNDQQASTFTYIWEWEVTLIPDHFLLIHDQDIITAYAIHFDFGELELDQLVTAGYFEKTVALNTETEVIIHYHLKAVNP